MPELNWASSRENLFTMKACDQIVFKPACSATEASQRLETLDYESII